MPVLIEILSKLNLALLCDFDWRIPIYYFKKDSIIRQVPIVGILMANSNLLFQNRPHKTSSTYCRNFTRVYVYLFLQVYTRESLAINVKVNEQQEIEQKSG